MSAARIDGRAVAAWIAAETIAKAGALPAGFGFAAIIVGDDPASKTYVALKERACKEAGGRFELHAFDDETPQQLLIETIGFLNGRDDIDAVLVQLPLPPHIDPAAVVAAIDPTKDADGFHPKNLALLAEGAPRVLPPLPLAIREMLRSTGEPLAGKTAAIVARADVFHEGLATVLATDGIAPTSMLPTTVMTGTLQAFDIIIVAAGVPDFLRADMIKPGAIVIDVGSNRVDGRMTGDVAADVAEKAARLSPVPGGVGPVTVAAVVANAVALAEARQRPRA